MPSRSLTFPVLALFAATAFAQVNTSNMDGIVTDSQRAAVPKAEVSISNPQTGQVYRVLTDDKGHWAVPRALYRDL